MDELRSKRRTMRRLLLAAVVCNIASLSDAAEPKSNSSHPTTNDRSVPFRSLLMEGWNAASPESKLTFQGPQRVAPPTPELCQPGQMPQLKQLTVVEDVPLDDFTALIQNSADQQRRLIKGDSSHQSIGKLASSITKPLSTEPQSILVLGTPLSETPTLSLNELSLNALPQNELSLNALPALIGPDLTPETKPFVPDAYTPDTFEPKVTEAEAVLPKHADVESAKEQPLEFLRDAAKRRGFGMLAIDEIGEPILPGQPATPELSITQTIHATKLLQLAREQLSEATSRMHRNANHSAKKLTLQALRNVVTMKDVQSGGNHHAKQLEAALEAIRESEDFTGKFGPVDQAALVRLITVHETDVLRNAELDNLSSLRATEMYLAVARENLIAATHSVREASDALVLMGQIEKALADDSDVHGGALAVTLQRAAIEIDPSNAVGFYELGSTLLSQGLADEAFQALSRSVSLQPNRSGYEQLLKAARQVGDVNTAQDCVAALRNPNLSRRFPVQRLHPQAFAATYRPTNTTIARNAKPNAHQPSTVEAKAVSTKTPPRKTGGLFRSLFTPRKL